MKNIPFAIRFFAGISIFFAFSGSLTAQSAGEIESMKLYPAKVTENSCIDSSGMYASEYDLLLRGLFRLYKNHISSQDIGNCMFYPSCSEYALMSIRKQGIIVGTIDAIDRLIRCNRFSPDYYLDKTNSGLIIDPVRNIRYEEK
ncbi:MAG: membrane protein insertion efficiency factor YidD [Bacteroidales bacterium]|nr:membrane protein insertion efficiency factor YidD [Bacteroidales bacterium]MBN2699660.1 membrane protein insertion efficiency factor YidD [Bacteroidales bacterium]